jgi:hypothetical protein
MQDEPEKIRRLIYDWDMQLMMNDRNLETIEQVRQFMEGSEAFESRALSVEEKYNWIEEVMTPYERLKTVPLTRFTKTGCLKPFPSGSFFN